MTDPIDNHVKALHDGSTMSKQQVVDIPPTVLEEHFAQLPAVKRDAIRAAFATRERTTHLLPVVFGLLFAAFGYAAGRNAALVTDLVAILLVAAMCAVLLFVGLWEFGHVRRATAIGIRLNMAEQRLTRAQRRRAERT